MDPPFLERQVEDLRRKVWGEEKYKKFLEEEANIYDQEQQEHMNKSHKK